MARRIREEIIEDVPVTRRVTTERRRVGPAYGTGNPLALVLAGLLLVFILVMVFGYLL